MIFVSFPHFHCSQMPDCEKEKVGQGLAEMLQGERERARQKYSNPVELHSPAHHKKTAMLSWRSRQRRGKFGMLNIPFQNKQEKALSTCSDTLFSFVTCQYRHSFCHHEFAFGIGYLENMTQRMHQRWRVATCKGTKEYWK